MRPIIVAAILAAVLGRTVADAAPPILVGVWTGIGMQVTAAGKQEEWTIRLTLNRDGSGSIEYPSLACGGALTPLAQLGPLAYRETITHGNCVSGGTIRMRSAAAGKLIWGWTAEGTRFSDLNGSAMLFPAGQTS